MLLHLKINQLKWNLMLICYFVRNHAIDSRMVLHVNGKKVEVNKKIFKLLMDSDASGFFSP